MMKKDMKRAMPISTWLEWGFLLQADSLSGGS